MIIDHNLIAHLFFSFKCTLKGSFQVFNTLINMIVDKYARFMQQSKTMKNIVIFWSSTHCSSMFSLVWSGLSCSCLLLSTAPSVSSPCLIDSQIKHSPYIQESDCSIIMSQYNTDTTWCQKMELQSDSNVVQCANGVSLEANNWLQPTSVNKEQFKLLVTLVTLW